MHVEQIAVFLENKSGRIAEVTSILAEAGINIRALSLADTIDFGVLRLIVDNIQQAEGVLKENNFTIKKTRVIAVEVEDKPGGLHKLMALIGKTNLNVEYMYAVVQQSMNNAVMVFRFENTDEALKVLGENDVTIIDSQRLLSL